MTSGGEARALSAALSLASLAGCYDWDRFARPPSTTSDGGAQPGPDGQTARDAGGGGAQGEESGDFACATPFALVPVMARGALARIERISLAGGAPQPCRALRVWGFREDEPIRAVAVLGDRVLAAGDLGACVLDVGAGLSSGRYTSYPITSGAVVRDAFVFNAGSPRFAVALAVGTAGAINTFVIEDAPGALTRVVTSSTSPRIPAALIGGGFLRAVASDPRAPYRLYGAREASDYVVSVLADNSDRRVVRESTSGPELYESVASGLPYMATQPNLGLTTRGGGYRFSTITGGAGSSGAPCEPCRTVTHALPVSADNLSYALVCDSAPEPGLFSYRTGSCAPIRTWASGSIVGRAAVRYE